MGRPWQAIVAALAVSICPALSIPTHADFDLLGKRGGSLQFLNRRADEDFDPWDLSSLTKIAAIGDSYSAGIGAGKRLGGLNDLGAWGCSRYDQSYPNLVNQNTALGDPSKRKFQFESCSGALTKEIRDEQVKRIDDGQHAIMLSAGGNDAGLVSVLNQCVYQIFAPNKVTAGLMSKFPAVKAIEWLTDGDLSNLARTCEETLEDSKKMIEDAKFSEGLDSLISKTKEKLGDGGILYYTGYAQFWSDDMSDEDSCSNESWSVFLSGADKWSFQEPVKLTADRRKKMNEMVSAVNQKISDAVKKAGDNVVFVDYDWYIGQSGGQFCAKGVREPNPSRSGLKFYELDPNNALGTSPFKRGEGDVYKGTFEYDVNRLGELARAVDSKLKDDALPDDKMSEEESSGHKRLVNPLPDGYGRIFHPTISAHEDIAGYVVYHMALTNGARHKAETKPEEVSLVPYGEGTCPTNAKEKIRPECEKSLLSGVPYNVFSGVYGKFCDQVDKKQGDSLDWIVGVDGNQIPHRKRGFLRGRTPPPDPSKFKDSRFTLQWEPSSSSKRDDGGLQPRQEDCAASCKEAYQTISLNCGHTGGEGNGMAAEAEVSVGCGKYSYKIEGPHTPDKKDAKKVKRTCHKKDQWGPLQDKINSAPQAMIGSEMCEKMEGKKIKAGDKDFEYGLLNDVYSFRIGWMDNCQSTAKEVDVQYPLGRDDKNNCESLLRFAYKMCEGENEGLGGYYEVGCVKYEFTGRKPPSDLYNPYKSEGPLGGGNFEK